MNTNRLQLFLMLPFAVTLLSCQSIIHGFRGEKRVFVPVNPIQNSVIEQHTDDQKEFVKLLAEKPAQQKQDEWLGPRRKKQADLSLPCSNVFSWNCLQEGAVAISVEISEKPSFEGPMMRFAVETGENSVQVHSLKANTSYYWRVAGTDAEGRAVTSPAASFRTADEIPRWIFVGGVSNVRDMGGWRTKDGRRVRQGLVYRGGEMGGHMTATAEGLRFLEHELKLRSLLDLRGSGELQADPNHGSALSPAVQWFNTPLAGYAPCSEDVYKTQYAKAFRICMNEANLPLYTHCWGGADRTGTLIFLLNAALGVPEDDLLLDYELTSLSIWGSRSRYSEPFQGLLAYLESLAPGKDMQEKAIAYWKAAGISEEEISRFQSLFLE